MRDNFNVLDFKEDMMLDRGRKSKTLLGRVLDSVGKKICGFFRREEQKDYTLPVKIDSFPI